MTSGNPPAGETEGQPKESCGDNTIIPDHAATLDDAYRQGFRDGYFAKLRDDDKLDRYMWDQLPKTIGDVDGDAA